MGLFYRKLAIQLVRISALPYALMGQFLSQGGDAVYSNLCGASCNLAPACIDYLWRSLAFFLLPLFSLTYTHP